MLWITVGAVVGFFIGGALGTVLAPRGRIDPIIDVQERLRAARIAALAAADRVERATEQHFEEVRGRPFRRRRGRRR